MKLHSGILGHFQFLNKLKIRPRVCLLLENTLSHTTTTPANLVIPALKAI